MSNLKESIKKVVSAEVSRQFTVLRSEMLLEIGRLEQRMMTKLLSENRSNITESPSQQVNRANNIARDKKPSLLEMLYGKVDAFDDVSDNEAIELSDIMPDMNIKHKPFEIPNNAPVPKLFESSTISGTDGHVVNVNNDQTKKVLQTIGTTNFREKIKAMEKHAKRR